MRKSTQSNPGRRTLTVDTVRPLTADVAIADAARRTSVGDRIGVWVDRPGSAKGTDRAVVEAAEEDAGEPAGPPEGPADHRGRGASRADHVSCGPGKV